LFFKAIEINLVIQLYGS